MTTFLPDIQPEVDAAMDQLVDDLQKARDIIAENGLIKKRFSGDRKGGGSACIIGALARVQGFNVLGSLSGHPRLDRATFALSSTLGKPGSHPVLDQIALYDFNDESFTTEDDVVALFNLIINNLKGAS